MASRETTVLFRAEVDAQGAITGFKKVEDALGGVQAQSKKAAVEVGTMGGAMESGLRSMVGYAAGFMGVAKAAEFAGGSIRKAIDAREMEDLFKVSLGSMADEARDWAAGLNKSLGLSTVELGKQVGIWSTMFASMGLGKAKAVELGESLTKLGADMGSFYHEDPSLMFEKLSAGMAGEIEPLKRLGVMVTQQTVQDYAWRTGMVATGQQLTQSQAILARYGVIMEATSKAQGNLALTLNSPANQLKVLNTRVTELQVSLGKFVTEAPAFVTTIRTWQGWLASWTESLNAAKDAHLDLRGEMAKPLVGDTAEAERTLKMMQARQAEAGTLQGQLAPGGQYSGQWQEYASRKATAGQAPLAFMDDAMRDVEAWLKRQPAQVQAAAAAWERYRGLQSEIGALSDRAAAAAKMAADADKERAAEAQRAAEQAKADRQSQLADYITDAQARMDTTENALQKLLNLGREYGSNFRLDEDLGPASQLLDTWRQQAAELVALTREKERAATASKVQASMDGKLQDLQRGMVAAVASQVDGWDRMADAKLRVNEVDKDSVASYQDTAKALEDYADQVSALTNAPAGFVKWLDEVASKLRQAADVQEALNAGTRLQVYLDGEAAKAVHDLGVALDFEDAGNKALLEALETRTKAVNDAWNGLNRSVRDTAAAGVTNGLLAALKGDDFAKAWGETWASLANVAADKLQGMLSDLMAGKSGTDTLQNAGLLTESGAFNAKGAGAMTGSLLLTQGQAHGNRDVAAIGGAIQGAFSAAMATSNPFIIVAAAIVAAAAGYFSTANPKQVGYNIQTGTGGSTVSYQGVGPSYEQQAEMSRELTDKVRETSAAFRDLLFTLGQSGNLDPYKGGIFTGMTRDASADFQLLLKGALPRSVAESFKPALGAALAAWGVDEKRAEDEIQRLFTGDFDKALTALTNWVNSIKGLRDLIGDLSKDQVAEVSKGSMERFRDSMGETLDQVGRLSEGLAGLTSEEQVARAQTIGKAIEEGLSSAQGMLQEVLAARQAIGEAFTQFYQARDLSRAGKSGGPMAQADLVSGWFTEAAGKVGTARDPQELQKFTGAALQYGQQLLQLADQLEAAAESYKAMGKDLAALLADVGKGTDAELKAMRATGAEAFGTGNTDALARVAELKVGLEGLAPQDQLDRLGQIRDLTRTTYENNLNYLQEIVAAQDSVRSTFSNLFTSFQEGEAQKQGPAAQGQFYVKQLMDLQAQLRSATDPKVIQDLMSQASGWASKLYGMGDAVKVNGGSALAWLEPFLKELQGQAEGKLGGQVDAVQSANDALASSLAGLGTLVDTQATALGTAADKLRELVDTTLADTLTTANDLLTGWGAELQTAIDALRKFAGEVLAILEGPGVTGNPSVNPFTEGGLKGGGSDGTVRGRIPNADGYLVGTNIEQAGPFGGLDDKLRAAQVAQATATRQGTSEVEALAAAAARTAKVLGDLAAAAESNDGAAQQVNVAVAVLDPTAQAIRLAQRVPRRGLGGVG